MPPENCSCEELEQSDPVIAAMEMRQFVREHRAALVRVERFEHADRQNELRPPAEEKEHRGKRSVRQPQLRQAADVQFLRQLLHFRLYVPVIGNVSRKQSSEA